MKATAFMMTILFLALSLIGCGNDGQIADGQSILEESKPFLNYISLHVYKNHDSYTVIIEENERIKSVVFSADRTPSNIVGFELQNIDNLEDYLGDTRNEVEISLGEMHADIGSGFSMPSYITNDGYLVSFTIIDGIVQHVGKTDLLSGEAIEWCDLYTGTNDT